MKFLAVKTAAGGVEGFSHGLFNGGLDGAWKGTLGGLKAGAISGATKIGTEFAGNFWESAEGSLLGITPSGNGTGGNGRPTYLSTQAGKAALRAVISRTGVENMIMGAINSMDFQGLGAVGQLAVKLNLPVKGARLGWDFITGYGENMVFSPLNTNEHRIDLERENAQLRSYENQFSGAMF